MRYSYIVLLFLLFSSLFVKAQDDRRVKIINIINKELIEVDKISKQYGGNNPSLYLKKAELYLEKGRLEREIENQRYLGVPAQKRSQISKSSFFQASSQSFQEAQNICKGIISSYPQYEHIGSVYFILAYYMKENGNNNEALKNFNKARISAQSSETRYRSEIAMAEIYYNANKCSEAIKLYRNALAEKNDKWKTKDLYNYGWCLYKTENNNEAIEALKESHRLSQSPKYIDMSETIENDIIIFYVAAGKLDEGLEFIQSRGHHQESAVNELVGRLVSGGEFDKAEKLLYGLIKQSDTNKKHIYYAMLFLNYDYIDWKKSTQVARVLNHYKKNNLIEMKSLIEIQKKSLDMMANLQQKIIKEKKNLYIEGVIAHGILAEGQDTNEIIKINFSIAESLLASGDHGRALPYYLKAYDLSDPNKSDKLKVASLNGALKCIAVENSNTPESLKRLEAVYERYLKVYPTGPKSTIIYDKLSQVYVKEGKLKEADILLQNYQKSMPQDKGKQEALLIILLDKYREIGDIASIKPWMIKVANNEMSLSRGYKEKIYKLSNSITENEASKLISSGDWRGAIEKYKLAYQSNTEAKTKGNIAFNISQIYDSQNELVEADLWFKNAMKYMEPKEVAEVTPQVINLSLKLFNQGYLEEGANNSFSAWIKNCTSADLFKNTIIMNNVIGYDARNIEMYAKAATCRIPNELKISIGKEILETIDRGGDLMKLKSLLSVQRQQEVWFSDQAFYYQKTGDTYHRSELLRFKSIENNAKGLEIKAHTPFTQIVNLNKSLNKVKLSSNIQTLSSQIKNILSQFSKMNDLTLQISTQSESYTRSLNLLIDSYQVLETEFKNYMKRTKDAEIIKSLTPVLGTIVAQKNDFYKKSLANISKSKNYSSRNHDLLEFIGVPVRSVK